MKITIDISPEEVIELTKGNTEIPNDMTMQVTKLEYIISILAQGKTK